MPDERHPWRRPLVGYINSAAEYPTVQPASQPRPYAADSSALAVLEVLVHLGKVSVLPSYSLVTGRLPPALMEDLEESTLRAGWNASPAPPAVQSMGDAWIRSRRSLALRVPSAIVQGSYSVLINPAHPDVGQFIVEAATPYSFDARLIKILSSRGDR